MDLHYRYLNPEEYIGSNDFRVVESFLRDTGRKNIGWHYVIDLAWIYSRVKSWARGLHVLDAGGGRGPAQFLLAEMGYNVTNIHLVHVDPSFVYRYRYGTRLRKLGSYVETDYVGHL